MTVGALMAVNAVGDVRDPETGRLLAGARDAARGRRLVDTARGPGRRGSRPAASRPVNTTIGVVATSAALDKPEAARVAPLGMLGFARALSPPHLASDGDALFCALGGRRPADVTAVGLAAADAVAVAIARAVQAATGLPGLPAAGDL